MTHNIKHDSNNVLYCEYCGIRDFTEECKFKLHSEERELKYKEKEFTEQSKLKKLEIMVSKDSSYAHLVSILLLFSLLFILIWVMYYGMDNIGKKISEMIARCNKGGWLAALQYLMKK